MSHFLSSFIPVVETFFFSRFIFKYEMDLVIRLFSFIRCDHLSLLFGGVYQLAVEKCANENPKQYANCGHTRNRTYTHKQTKKNHIWISKAWPREIILYLKTYHVGRKKKRQQKHDEASAKAIWVMGRTIAHKKNSWEKKHEQIDSKYCRASKCTLKRWANIHEIMSH